ncbi:hypothetical protein JCM16496A_12690 [Bacteroides rodentium JCM 16496]
MLETELYTACGQVVGISYQDVIALFASVCIADGLHHGDTADGKFAVGKGGFSGRIGCRYVGGGYGGEVVSVCRLPKGYLAARP